MPVLHDKDEVLNLFDMSGGTAFLVFGPSDEILIDIAKISGYGRAILIATRARDTLIDNLQQLYSDGINSEQPRSLSEFFR